MRSEVCMCVYVRYHYYTQKGIFKVTQLLREIKGWGAWGWMFQAQAELHGGRTGKCWKIGLFKRIGFTTIVWHTSWAGSGLAHGKSISQVWQTSRLWVACFHGAIETPNSELNIHVPHSLLVRGDHVTRSIPKDQVKITELNIWEAFRKECKRELSLSLFLSTPCFQLESS
jgi:hypothetical protein